VPEVFLNFNIQLRTRYFRISTYNFVPKVLVAPRGAHASGTMADKRQQPPSNKLCFLGPPASPRSHSRATDTLGANDVVCLGISLVQKHSGKAQTTVVVCIFILHLRCLCRQCLLDWHLATLTHATIFLLLEHGDWGDDNVTHIGPTKATAYAWAQHHNVIISCILPILQSNLSPAQSLGTSKHFP
jgi:hypothetical protein